MKKIFTNKKGFSLIDILIYSAILGTVVISISSLFALGISQRGKSDAISKVNNDLARTAEIIKTEVGNADTVTLPAFANTGSELRVTNGGVVSRFYLANNNLYLDKNTQTERINSSYIVVNSISFQNLGTNLLDESVQVIVNYSYSNPSNKIESKFSNSLQFTITLNE